CLARNAATWRQGKKIANEPLRAKVGEYSERIVARDPPATGRYGVGTKRAHRRALAQRHPPSFDRDTTAAASSMHGCLISPPRPDGEGSSCPKGWRVAAP